MFAAIKIYENMIKLRIFSKHLNSFIVEQLEKTYTKFSQKSYEVTEFYTNIIFVFSSCFTIHERPF